MVRTWNVQLARVSRALSEERVPVASVTECRADADVVENRVVDVFRSLGFNEFEPLADSILGSLCRGADIVGIFASGNQLARLSHGGVVGSPVVRHFHQFRFDDQCVKAVSYPGAIDQADGFRLDGAEFNLAGVRDLGGIDDVRRSDRGQWQWCARRRGNRWSDRPAKAGITIQRSGVVRNLSPARPCGDGKGEPTQQNSEPVFTRMNDFHDLFFKTR